MNILETDRLILRTLEMSDLDVMTELNQDPKVMEYFPGLQNKDETKKFIDRTTARQKEYGYSWYAAELKLKREFIGFIGINKITFDIHFAPAVEIGWRLAAKHWGQGYAPEAARAVLDYAFNKLHIDEIVSFTTVNNLKSRRVMEKIGMTHNIEDDFSHPAIDKNHPLSNHVLYRIARKPYLFEYDNLGFRVICDSDIDFLAMLDCDPDVKKFFPDGAISIDEIPDRIKKYKEQYIKQGYGCYLVFDVNTGEFIGRAGISDLESGETEVGYLILKKIWGKGFATRILKSLLYWAKHNFKKDRVIAFTPVDHQASIMVMKKAGMSYMETKVMPHISIKCVVYEWKE